jgi:hypothetical protein
MTGVLILHAQEKENSIDGHIYDKSNGKPIEDVNVYLSNTTWGSSTNKEGYYKIRQIPQGMHELVVTIIGYEYETKSVLVKSDSKLKFDFRLKPVIYETEATLVEGSVPTEWLRDVQFFKYYFLGKSLLAQDCEIENEEVLEFTKPNRAVFVANAIRPLRIVNRALGYRIDCVLVSFIYNRDQDIWRWSIKPKFTELETMDDENQADWKGNRITAYNGSLYHFLKAFRDEQLKEEGFDIYPVEQAGQKVPRSLWRATIIDYEDFIQPGILSTEKKLNFTNYLHVVYQNAYVSWIKLNYTDITLDEFGYPEEGNPYDVFGHWASGGVANLLPKNYINQK